ncbi:hypothetical protein AHAS_Ahas11G0231000 [Arachis hypogaea]
MEHSRKQMPRRWLQSAKHGTQYYLPAASNDDDKGRDIGEHREGELRDDNDAVELRWSNPSLWWLRDAVTAGCSGGAIGGCAILREKRRDEFLKKMGYGLTGIDLATSALTQDDYLKKFAADKAVEYVKSGMVLGLGIGSTVASSLPSSVISFLPVNSPTSSASLPPSSLRNRHVLSKSRSLSLTIIFALILSSMAPIRWTRPQPCKRPRWCSSLLEATFDKFIVVVDETKLVSGLGGATLR